MTRRPVAVAIAALVTAAGVFLWRPWSDPWSRLMTAARGSVRGRLADLGETSWRHTRSALGSTNDLRELAERVLTSDADEHQKAVAAWLAGDMAGEVRLETLASSEQPSAAVLNDLAVVLSAKSASASPETLIYALAAADRAIEVEPSHAAARFNRAVIIDRLGLRSLAVDAYGDYLRLDSASEWSLEARDRIRSLQSSATASSQWRDVVPRLVLAAQRGDSATILAAAQASPEDARSYGENQFLPGWGAAVRNHETGKAVAALFLTRTVGNALRRRSGESLLADSVAAIDNVANDEARTAALAAAHVQYGEAARLYSLRDIAHAAAEFAVARELFERGGSPLALLARYFCTSALVDAGRRADALGALAALERDTPERYHALHAAMHRLSAVIAYFDGSYGEAVRGLELARDGYRTIGEVQNAEDMSARLASTLCELGRPHQAWPLHRASFQSAAAAGSPLLLQSVLHSTAFTALSEQRWDLAHALLKLEVDVHDPSPRRYAEALTWQVLAAARANMPHTAQRSLVEARRAAAEIIDPAFREGAENDLRLLEALLVAPDSPNRAATLFGEYLAVTEHRARRSRVPEVLVARAGCYRRLGDDASAERDLRQAIALIEERRRHVDRDLLRDTFLGKASAAYTALADLLDRRGDVPGALEASDLDRARIILDRAPVAVPSVANVAASLPPRTALLTYGFFGDRLVIYAVRRDGVERFEERLRAGIEQEIASFVDAIRRNDAAAFTALGQSLYSILVAPARDALDGSEQLVVVGDPQLDGLPFAALVQPNGRYLIQDTAIVVAPGVRAYGDASTRADAFASTTMASIGNPAFDQTAYPELQALPAAGDEARELGALYPGATVLVGSDATRSATITAIEQAAVVHVATHALTNSRAPDRTRLLLAGRDALTTADIAAMDLHRAEVVVLAGCRTSSTGRAYGYVQSLGAAFLAAGARNVVGALWDIDDEPARQFSLRFHRALRNGVAPDEALRRTQLGMVGSRPVSAWAAMQLYAVRR